MSKHHYLAALKIKEIQYFLFSVGSFTLASRAGIVIIGFQIYELTKSPLALGWMGLFEAIPAISLSLIGGYVADHFDRRRILLLSRLVYIFCALTLGIISLNPTIHHLWIFYSVIFIAGIARGFADPTATAFEAQIVPKELTVNAASWIGSTWLSCSVVGPALVGFTFAKFGASTTYFFITAVFILSGIFMSLIKPKPKPVITKHESIWESIRIGCKFVFGEQILVGAMALDLFAVLFGGAVALLPIFASDILHIGPQGLGLLTAAPALGSLLMMLYSTKHPPIHYAGRNLLLCVAGFGVSIIIFAFSKIFLVSWLALFFSGLFDGVSMIIRRSLVRFFSPDHMRGRVAAVSWIFIGASNEIGAFESGFVAHLIGTIPCVWVGGVITLIVVGFTAIKAPKLRKLIIDVNKLNSLSGTS